jgi:hypothetical protein
VGQLSTFVNVDLQEFDFAVGFLDSFFQNGCKFLARSAPIGVKVDDHWFGSISDNHGPIFGILQFNDALNVVLIELLALFF